jgi:hypothetical protein
MWIKRRGAWANHGIWAQDRTTCWRIQGRERSAIHLHAHITVLELNTKIAYIKHGVRNEGVRYPCCPTWARARCIANPHIHPCVNLGEILWDNPPRTAATVTIWAKAL